MTRAKKGAGEGRSGAPEALGYDDQKGDCDDYKGLARTVIVSRTTYAFSVAPAALRWCAPAARRGYDPHPAGWAGPIRRDARMGRLRVRLAMVEEEEVTHNYIAAFAVPAYVLFAA